MRSRAAWILRSLQLMDYYLQECEQIRTIEKINQLQYVMLLDFCRRAGDTRIPDGISPDVYACMTYIRNHYKRIYLPWRRGSPRRQEHLLYDETFQK